MLYGSGVSAYSGGNIRLDRTYRQEIGGSGRMEGQRKDGSIAHLYPKP
jgi:hypothetical protein